MKLRNETLAVAGFAELTAANSSRFRQAVCAALDGHAVVEIDLSRTTFMDCAGLGALIAIRNQVRGENGVVRLVNPRPPMRQLLERVRAGLAFRIVNLSPEVCLGETRHANLNLGRNL